MPCNSAASVVLTFWYPSLIPSLHYDSVVTIRSAHVVTVAMGTWQTREGEAATNVTRLLQSSDTSKHTHVF